MGAQRGRHFRELREDIALLRRVGREFVEFLVGAETPALPQRNGTARLRTGVVYAGKLNGEFSVR
jgi:hypothetical protein